MFTSLSDLDLRLIRVFLAIVDAGGLSSAQATLNVGQPTISTQLATLEARLGYRLCERGRGGFALTARGAQFVDACRTLLTAIENFDSTARNVGRKLVGTLTLGIIGNTSVSANARISEAIARFRERDASVHLSVLVRSPGELEEMILADRIQMAIGYFWHRVPSLDYREIFSEDQLAYCSRAHPLFARAGKLALKQVDDYPWAWRGYPLPEASALTPRTIGAVADNMEAVAMLVLSGKHLGYLPEHFAASYVKQGLLAPLNARTLRYRVPFQMVTRVDGKRNARSAHGTRGGTRDARREILDAFLDDMTAAHANNASNN
jgi:LysR family transcriptional regulator, transcriptional activator for bauABCD operon